MKRSLELNNNKTLPLLSQLSDKLLGVIAMNQLLVYSVVSGVVKLKIKINDCIGISDRISAFNVPYSGRNGRLDSKQYPAIDST